MFKKGRDPADYLTNRVNKQGLQTGYGVMRHNRMGEHGMVPPRNDRFFQVQDYWYYSTREGVDIGPFDNFEEASVGAAEFIDFICGAEPSFARTLEQYSNRSVA